MEINVTGGEPPLAAIYDAQESAHACIAAHEFTQAIEWFAKAHSLVPVSSDWFSDATSPTGSCDPIHALSTTLTLERADCHLRLHQFEEANGAADSVLSTARRNVKAKRVKCEALFGLEQQTAAMKIWTDLMLETTDSPELDLLKTRYPVAAVHVFHAVKTAQVPAKRSESTVERCHPAQPPAAVSTSTFRTQDYSSLSSLRNDEASAFSPFMNVGAALLSKSNSVPISGTRVTLGATAPATRCSMSDDDDGGDVFYDPILTDIHGNHSWAATASHSRPSSEAGATTPDLSGVSPREEATNSKASQPSPRGVDSVSALLSKMSLASDRDDSGEDTVSSLEVGAPPSPTARDSYGNDSNVFIQNPSYMNDSMVLVGPPATSSLPSEFLTSPSVTESPPPAPTKRRVDSAALTQKLQLAKECIPQKDFIALLNYIDEVMEMKPMPSFLFERALCIQAIPTYSVADKLAALSEYVAQNPLDAEWIPHALYMMSAHYIEQHEYSDAARMRFLADECEHLRERVGTFAPIDCLSAFPQKAEVENAFTPPWLVLSFDEQRRSIQTGLLACRTCPPNSALVPLLKYVEHRTSVCPGLATLKQ